MVRCVAMGASKTPLAKGMAMTQQALIRGDVEFRAGDGMMVAIPDGPVEIDIADDDSVTLSWVEGADASATAITRDEFDRYVAEGKIKLA
jgi:Mg-chelatase subunit ChlD